MEEITITKALVIGTVLYSLWAWNNREIYARSLHYPYKEHRDREFYRWISYGFVHADYVHLFFNMWALWMFGDIVEHFFKVLFPYGKALYILFYIVAIPVSCYFTYVKHKDNPSYTAVGASGAVSAIVFAGILFYPTMGISLMFIPFYIPGFLFGILYLWYSIWASRNANDNIGHTAHYVGSLFGFFFPLFIKPELFSGFLGQVLDYVQGLF